MRRAPLLLAVAVVVAAGLTLRLVPLGLPRPLVKYGGSALWGAMVHLVVLTAWPRLAGWPSLAVAGLIAVAVETSRLVPLPPLDAFRLTLAGQLLLGRLFSAWNLVAYAAGIGAAAVATAILCRVRPPSGAGARRRA